MKGYFFISRPPRMAGALMIALQKALSIEKKPTYLI
jgi:hypothetical protein